MNIKDCLHLYKDVLVEVKKKLDTDYHIGRVCEITSRSNHGDWIVVVFEDVITTTTSGTFEQQSSNMHHFFFGEDHIIPLFRPLSDITKNEVANLMGVKDVVIDGDWCPPFFQIAWYDSKDEYRSDHLYIHQMHPDQVFYLLSKHFDLFGLIDAGLALAKKEAGI